ncbi:MAG: NTP/NDP exchange transporter [Verrucomicrobia bacterium]|nr:NTP/NDP exchange transporter [Verrucomicrobiota bacterium]
MSKENKDQFGLFRSIFWPVHRSEVKKVLSMLLLLFLLCVSYGVLRNLKDTIILTARNSGAEVIPFIKVWGMLPGVFLATWFYTRLRRYFKKENVFYIIITSFVAYFLLFAFYLYPNSQQLHLEKVGDWMSSFLPQGFQGFIALVRNWTFTSFYVISELWAVIVLAVLYWGFANDFTQVNEAKRTYGILNIGSNIAPIMGGTLALTFSNSISLPFLSSITDHWTHTITQLIILISLLGIASMAVYFWINRKILDPQEAKASLSQTVEEKAESAKKPRLSLRESVRYILRSRYLVPLAIIVLGYNISINFTDVLWKEQLKRFFSDPNEMLEHMNKITVGIGILATIGGVFFSFMVTRLGWTFTAIITPVVMTTLAVGFFTFLFCGDALMAVSSTLFGLTPFAMTVYCGSVQNCLSKAGKYSVFDATKELAFLPLDAESKLKGKAAIDGLGSGIGKSGSSLTYQGFIIVLGSVALSTPYIAGILFCVLLAWIFCVVSLGKQFKKMTTGDQVAASAGIPELSQ